MAPKSDTLEGRILSFVNEQNKPLNAQNVADALQTLGVKKSLAQKTLDAAANAGTISFKDFGKQRIYIARQDKLQVVNSGELEAMKLENAKLQQEASLARNACAETESLIRMTEASLTSEQIVSLTKKYTEENAAMDAKLAKLRDGSVKLSPETKKKAEEQYLFVTLLWKKRKRIFKDLWDTITESMTKDLSQFKDELGIETDEDLGIDINMHCNLSNKRIRTL